MTRVEEETNLSGKDTSEKRRKLVLVVEEDHQQLGKLVLAEEEIPQDGSHGYHMTSQVTHLMFWRYRAG